MLLPHRGIKPIYLGGSFGVYTGMEMLCAYPDKFSAAMILMTAQTVGVGRGMAASLGVTLSMDAFMSLVSPSTVLKALMGETRKNGHIDTAMAKTSGEMLLGMAS